MQYAGDFAAITSPELITQHTTTKDLVIGLLVAQVHDESRVAPSSLDAYPAPWVVPAGHPKKTNKEKKEHRRKKSARDVRAPKKKKKATC
jgi:hypothetical protein